MTNAYISLDLFKSSGVLNITGSGDDARLLSVIESAGRVVDGWCNRHFYVVDSTKKFDGNSVQSLRIPDLVSVNTNGLKTDDNKDRTFETTWGTSDYLLAPTNADPTTTSYPGSRPYTSVDVDTDSGTKSAWPEGKQTVQIAGQWGWWRHLVRATETADAIADATTTTVAVSTRTDIEAGHTLLIDSEQLYVKRYSGDTLTVVRGVNGTAAVSHGGGASIDIYEYPDPIVEATILQAARLWRRKDAPLGASTGFGETKQKGVPGRLDPDVRALVALYRKSALGVGV